MVMWVEWLIDDNDDRCMCWPIAALLVRKT